MPKNPILISGAVIAAASLFNIGIGSAESGHGAGDRNGHATSQGAHGPAKAQGHAASRVFAKSKGHAPAAKHGGGASRGHGAHWGYAGPSGPEHWGDLKPAYQTCKTGAMQSPVDLRATLSAGLPKIKFDYRIGTLSILNNGHTVQVNVPKGSGITVGGKRFDLLQFHFHTPSEHNVTGQVYPLEMHLVHKSADGQLAVVCVFMEAGAKNVALQEIWPHLPPGAGRKLAVKGVAINPRDLLPADNSYYRYMGSLTTPPCSGSVHWHVMRSPIKVGAGQIAAISRIMGGNARPTQAVRNRLIMGGN